MGDELTATQRNSWIVTVVEDKAKVSKLSELSLSVKETPKSPIWAANQVLYKTEPPKPPKTVASFYAMTYRSEAGNMDPADIDLLWEKVSAKQKIKCIEEHDTILTDYFEKFEHFIRSLERDELKAFRVFMKKRDGQDVGDSDSGSFDEDSFVGSLNKERVAQCSSFLLQFPLSAAKIQLFYPAGVAFQQ